MNPNSTTRSVKCANCRVREGIVSVPYRDVAETDRGDWIQEGTEYWCEECVEDEPRTHNQWGFESSGYPRF